MIANDPFATFSPRAALQGSECAPFVLEEDENASFMHFIRQLALEDDVWPGKSYSIPVPIQAMPDDIQQATDQQQGSGSNVSQWEESNPHRSTVTEGHAHTLGATVSTMPATNSIGGSDIRPCFNSSTIPASDAILLPSAADHSDSTSFVYELELHSTDFEASESARHARCRHTRFVRHANHACSGVGTDATQSGQQCTANDAANACKSHACVPEAGTSQTDALEKAHTPRRRRLRTIETEEQKVERLKEKNRRGQARYREKTKIQIQNLQEQVAVAKASLQDANRRYRALRHLNHCMRACSHSHPNGPPAARPAPSDTTGNHNACDPPQIHNPAAPPSPLEHSTAAQNTHTNTGKDGDADLVQLECAPRQMHDGHAWNAHSPNESVELCSQQVVARGAAGRGGVFGGVQQESMSPIEAFKACAGIQFEDIMRHMDQCMLHMQGSTTGHNNVISDAVHRYQHAACARMHASVAQQPLQPQHVCWFNHMPYDVTPGMRCSHSLGASSPECCLSLSLGFTVMSCECLLMVLERDILTAEGRLSDYVISSHPILTSRHMRPVLATLCDPTKIHSVKDVTPKGLESLDLNSLLSPPRADSGRNRGDSKTGENSHYVRCGVNERFSARTATKNMLRPLLHMHRKHLNLGVWRAACLACMHVAHTSLNSMLKKRGSHSRHEECATEERATSKQCTTGTAHISTRENHGGEGTRKHASDEDKPPHAHADASPTPGAVARECAINNCPGAPNSHQPSYNYSPAVSTAALGSSESAEASNPEASKSDDSVIACAMGWEQLDDAMVELLQNILQIFYEVLTENCMVTEVVEPQRMDVLLLRMHEMTCYGSITFDLMFKFAPISSVRMCSMHIPTDTVLAERQQIKLLQYLQLAPDQKSLIRQKWQSWLQQRHWLDERQDCVLRKLDDACMGISSVRPELQQLIDLLASSGSDSQGQPTREGYACKPQRNTECQAAQEDHQTGTEEADSCGAPQPLWVVDPRPPATPNVTASYLHYTTPVATVLENDVPPAPPMRTSASPISLHMPQQHMHSTGGHSTGVDATGSGDHSEEAFASRSTRGGPCSHKSLHTLQQQLHHNSGVSCSHPEPVSDSAPAQSATPPKSIDALSHDHATCETSSRKLSAEPSESPPEGTSSEASRAEGSSERMNVPDFLGMSSGRLQVVQGALQCLRDTHSTDFCLYKDCLALLLMPCWLLTEVQHARKLAARIEIGVDLVDTMRLFQAAAHELHWQDLFGDFRLES